MEGFKQEPQRYISQQTILPSQFQTNQLSGKVSKFASGVFESLPGGMYSHQDIPVPDFQCILVDYRETQPHFFKNTKIIEDPHSEIVIEQGFDQKKDSQQVFKQTTIKMNTDNARAPFDLPDIPLIYKTFTGNTSRGLYGHDCLLSCATVDVNSISNDPEDIARRIVDYRKTQPHFFKSAATENGQQKVVQLNKIKYSDELDATDRPAEINMPDIPLRWASFTTTNTRPIGTDQRHSSLSSNIPYRHVDNTKQQPHFYANTQPIKPSTSLIKEQLSYDWQIDSELQSLNQDSFAVRKFPSADSRRKYKLIQHKTYQNPIQEGYNSIDRGIDMYTFDKQISFPVLPEQVHHQSLWSQEDIYPPSLPTRFEYESFRPDQLERRQHEYSQIKKDSSFIKPDVKQTINQYLRNVKFNLESPEDEEQELFLKSNSSTLIPDIPIRKIDMTRTQPQFYFPDISRLSSTFQQKLSKSDEIQPEMSRLVSGEQNIEMNMPDIPRIYIRPEYLQPWFFTPTFIEVS